MSTDFHSFYSADRTLLPLLERWDMCCQPVPLDFYPGDEGGRVHVEGLSERISSSLHTIHMWKITKKRKKQED